MISTLMLSHIIWSHAALATLSWGLFFPLGAILVRVVTGNARNVHWMLQTFGFITFTAAFILGAWTATYLKLWVTFNGHAIIGTIIYGLTLSMPILGILHHKNYISTHNSYKFAWIHVYLGRVLILAGIINGGLGFQLGYYETHLPKLRQGEIAYGAIAGFIGLVWISVSIMACIRSKGDVAVGGESGQKVQGVSHLRNDSQDTAIAEQGLQKEKISGEQTNGNQAFENYPAAAAAPAANTTTTTTTTTTHSHPTESVTAAAQPQAGGVDTLHGGEHYNTRLANIVDPAVGASDKTTMFG